MPRRSSNTFPQKPSRRRTRAEMDSPDPLLSSHSQLDYFKRPRLDSSPAGTIPFGSGMAASALSRGASSSAVGTPAPAHGVPTYNKGKVTPADPFRPFGGARKLVIKNVRAAQSSPDVQRYLQRTWADLNEAIVAILAGNMPCLPFERLYRGVEDLCRHGQADKLYVALKQAFESHLNQVVYPKITADSGLPSLDVLELIIGHWTNWLKQTTLLRSVFSYLDQAYLLHDNSLLQINEIAIELFRGMLIHKHVSAFPGSVDGPSTDKSLGILVRQGMCTLVDLDRRGDEHFSPVLFKESVKMMQILGTYSLHFEPKFLTKSEAYFKGFGQSWSARGLKEYIHACRKLLRREDHRCIAFGLDSTTKSQLSQLAHAILVNKYAERLLDNDNVTELLRENEVESLRALYDLLRLSNIHQRLKIPWKEYVLKAGTAIIGDAERGSEMIVRMLELRHRLDVIVRTAFGQNDEFRVATRAAFISFINDRRISGLWSSGVSKIGEMVAKHLDLLLRGGLRSLPKELITDPKDCSTAKDRSSAEQTGLTGTADEDAELDRQLDSTLELFRFLEGKDAFEAFYKKDLARRLLLERCANQEAERSMLNKLRGECGPKFTHNLEQMFRDQDLAQDEMEAFKHWRHSNALHVKRPALDVKVLSSAAWPTYPNLPLNLPEAVGSQMSSFDRFYQGKHSGRSLSWKMALATCVMRARFPRGVKELCVSAAQAVVLSLFNQLPDGGFLAYDQISHGSGLTGDDLHRTLQSLACGRARVLTKHPRGREISATDTFTVNLSFSDPRVRIKINQIQLRETQDESRETHERVVQDRRFETQAAIVRIMKSRKSVGHAELVAEVINLTRRRGPVDAPSIKTEIATLIDKEYLERDGSSYTYLA